MHMKKEQIILLGLVLPGTNLPAMLNWRFDNGALGLCYPKLRVVPHLIVLDFRVPTLKSAFCQRESIAITLAPQSHFHGTNVVET